GHWHEGDRGPLRLVAPVGFVAFQLDAGALDVGLELVRAGADGELASVEVVDLGPSAGHTTLVFQVERDGAVLGDAAPQDAHAGQVVGKQRVRGARLDAQRLAIDGFDAGELFHHRRVRARD